MVLIEWTWITMAKGDGLEVAVLIKDGDEQYEPKAEDVITFTLKKGPQGAQTVLTKVLDNEDVKLIIDPADTANLNPGLYYYDLKLTSDGVPDTFIRDARFYIV